MAAIAGVLVSLNYGTFDFYIGFVTGIKAFTAAVLGWYRFVAWSDARWHRARFCAKHCFLG